MCPPQGAVCRATPTNCHGRAVRNKPVMIIAVNSAHRPPNTDLEEDNICGTVIAWYLVVFRSQNGGAA